MLRVKKNLKQVRNSKDYYCQSAFNWKQNFEIVSEIVDGYFRFILNFLRCDFLVFGCRVDGAMLEFVFAHVVSVLSV